MAFSEVNNAWSNDAYQPTYSGEVEVKAFLTHIQWSTRERRKETYLQYYASQDEE